MQKLTVLVVTHKDYEFPDSACYRPLFVGGKIASSLKSETFYRDNTGINIAVRGIVHGIMGDFTHHKDYLK